MRRNLLNLPENLKNYHMQGFDRTGKSVETAFFSTDLWGWWVRNQSEGSQGRVMWSRLPENADTARGEFLTVFDDSARRAHYDVNRAAYQAVKLNELTGPMPCHLKPHAALRG